MLFAGLFRRPYRDFNQNIITSILLMKYEVVVNICVSVVTSGDGLESKIEPEIFMGLFGRRRYVPRTALSGTASYTARQRASTSGARENNIARFQN